MKTSSLRKQIALLVAIHYLALAVGLPFLHRHGAPGPPPRTSAHQAALTHAAGSDDFCPACQWDQIAKAAAPAPLLWTQAERLVFRFQVPQAEDPFSPRFGLPSSRAPPAHPLLSRWPEVLA